MSVEDDRASLRLSYLRVMSALAGRDVSLRTVEDNTVTGVYQFCDRDSALLAVSRLSTPTHVMDTAIVRTADMDTVEFASAVENK